MGGRWAASFLYILDQQPTCRVKDLAAQMEVTHVTVTRILQRLSAEGLINKDPYGPCTLTETGRAMATRSRRRWRAAGAARSRAGRTPWPGRAPCVGGARAEGALILVDHAWRRRRLDSERARGPGKFCFVTKKRFA